MTVVEMTIEKISLDKMSRQNACRDKMTEMTADEMMID